MIGRDITRCWQGYHQMLAGISPDDWQGYHLMLAGISPDDWQGCHQMLAGMSPDVGRDVTRCWQGYHQMIGRIRCNCTVVPTL